MSKPLAPVESALTLVLTFTFAIAVVGSAGSSPSITARASRKLAPPLAFRDAKGMSLRLSSYKGRVVLLDFWATWCTGCKLEIPWFMEFEKKYRSRGLSALGVAVDDEGWRTVKTYLADHPITYPVVLADMDIMEKKFGLPASLPVTLLIDRKGRIALTHAGVVKKEKFEAEISELLEERAH